MLRVFRANAAPNDKVNLKNIVGNNAYTFHDIGYNAITQCLEESTCYLISCFTVFYRLVHMWSSLAYCLV